MPSPCQILALIRRPGFAGRTAASPEAALAQASFLARRLGGRLHVAVEPFDDDRRAAASDARPRPIATIAPPPAPDTPEAPADPAALGLAPDSLPLSASTGRLLRYVEDAAIDLIVADTPRECGPLPLLSSALVRTFAERADVPLFVPEHNADPSSFSRLLVPMDLSAPSVQALEDACMLASLYDASIDVLHVLERPHYVALNATDLLTLADATHAERTARRRIKSAIRKAVTRDVDIRTHIAHGNAADAITHFATQQATDLVVLASHGVMGRRQQPLGSVVKKVLHRMTRPVLLTRAFGRSLAQPATDARRHEARSSGHASANPAPSGDSIAGPSMEQRLPVPTPALRRMPPLPSRPPAP